MGNDTRVYFTIMSDIECETDLSIEGASLPCVMLDGKLKGFEIVLQRDFILRRLREEQGESMG
jgi:hypothetical protein